MFAYKITHFIKNNIKIKLTMKNLTVRNLAPFFILTIIAIAAIFIPSLPNFDDGKFNGADVAWILVATALVFLMTPGLAFFYGVMVHRKQVSSVMTRVW